ncbi:MAG TPA: hypothetical protein VF885_17210 [Arthrobacter sp.]
MTDQMTVAEYATATNEIRHNQSILAAAELAATRKAIRTLRTAAGRVEMHRQVQPKAARLIETAEKANRAAEHARLSRESLEDEATGHRRLVEATAECWGVTVNAVLAAEAKRIRP